MKEFKGTHGRWVVDKRVACVAIYPDGKQKETEGCHADDERNIAYSCKGAEYDDVVGYWSMDKKTVHDFTLMAAAPDLLEALQVMVGALGVMVTDADNCAEILKARAAISKALGEE